MTMTETIRMAAALAILAGAALQSASGYADPAGDTTDPVTGYHCLTRGCTLVQLPYADCACVKIPPNEQDARKVKLACYTGFALRKACPVEPRHGG